MDPLLNIYKVPINDTVEVLSSIPLINSDKTENKLTSETSTKSYYANIPDGIFSDGIKNNR